ncbi:MAG: AAA family ATPase [Flavobacteriales bacterium]
MNDFSTKKNLILLRGLPGAGKTALALLLSEHGRYPVFSVDDYFTDADGNYHFEFDKNHLAYKNCEVRTEDAMHVAAQKIFVHNTFVYNWEMEPYFKLAASYGYELFVITVEKYHEFTNTHGVSSDQLLKMTEKFEVKLK